MQEISFGENKFVRKCCTKIFSMMKFVYNLYTNWDSLEIQGDLFNRFYKYPCSLEIFPNSLQKDPLQVKSRLEIVK